MQIHVIRPGDTLYGLAHAYDVSVSDLVAANEIPNPDRLVVGQALVIPVLGRFHWVQPGESLYTISRRYQISISELAAINGITNPAQIPAGLRLYIPQGARPTVDVGAYIDPQITGAGSAQVVDHAGERLTFLQIFSYAANSDGSLAPIHDEPMIQAAYRHRVAPLMVITNFEEGTFSRQIATAILSDETAQNRLLDEAITLMEQKGYLGLDFDFEYLGAENRERYNAFLRKARARLDERGYFLSTALAPKIRGDQPGVLYEGHDYAAHGQIVDFIFFMTYEWGWSGGPPMAVSPIDQVRRVMEYAVSVVPRGKVMMGIPLYGYDWTLPYVPGGPFARSISPQQAIQLAARYGVEINYDDTSQAPYFHYYDEQGREHVVWFEDARSIQAKFNLVKELGLRGFFYWVLGRDFPQNWLLIEDNFTVRKRVVPPGG